MAVAEWTPFDMTPSIPEDVRGWVKLYNGWDEITVDCEALICNADILEITSEKGLKKLQDFCGEYDYTCPPNVGLWYYDIDAIMDKKPGWVKISDLKDRLNGILNNLADFETVRYHGYRPEMGIPFWARQQGQK